MKKTKVSDNAVRRLARYIRKLDALSQAGVQRISSADLGQQMGITPSQIRQDLSTFGEFGVQGYGYAVEELQQELRRIMGAQLGFTAVLIGAGKLGSALLSHFGFEDCGVKLLAAFDVCTEQRGTLTKDIPLYPMEQLPAFLEAHAVDIAVLTVPQSAVPEITRQLNQACVSAVWNFTNVELNELQDGMLVENMHFADSLYSLCYYLAEQNRNASMPQRNESSE